MKLEVVTTEETVFSEDVESDLVSTLDSDSDFVLLESDVSFESGDVVEPLPRFP